MTIVKILARDSQPNTCLSWHPERGCRPNPNQINSRPVRTAPSPHTTPMPHTTAAPLGTHDRSGRMAIGARSTEIAWCLWCIKYLRAGSFWFPFYNQDHSPHGQYRVLVAGFVVSRQRVRMDQSFMNYTPLFELFPSTPVPPEDRKGVILQL